MRSVIPFNDGWLYLPRQVGADAPDADFTPVTLPHTNIDLPHHNFDNLEYQFISTYRKRFTLPESPDGRRVYLDFDGAMIAATVSINGHTFPEHKGGYVPFSYDITDYLHEDGENLLVVHLDSTERKDIPPYGYVVDYLTFGGIYRDVLLRYVEPVHIVDVFVRTLDVLTNQPRVEADVTLVNQGDTPRTFMLYANFAYDEEEFETDQQVALDPGEIRRLTLQFPSGEYKLWSPENPILYDMGVLLHELDDHVNYFDMMELIPFGFREVHFDKDGSFYLNGEALMLRGLNRHQTYPYIGAAAPARLQRKDADIIKYELGCNIVRTSHYPQSPHFLDRCDEIGLLVFEEIPGWQHIGDDAWKGLALRDVQAMIERDRNHPSIILWGVRINESQDDSAFYEETNTLAHQLDPTRQTGGVRYIWESEVLEDVFTYNDFSNAVRDPIHTPHMITEFNGHMFPTKSWDQEERVVEHALRHARIQNLAAGNPKVAGAIGWCAFDYNTHFEFGSGDRICYHGVSDIFRLPKYAAYFYASQQDPAGRAVLQAATVWSMGDRSVGGNDPLWVFSNCDEIEVFVGQNNFGRHTPDRATFPHLPHPPFQISIGRYQIWGGSFEDLRLVGYVNGEAVAEQRIAAEGLPRALTLAADDSELRADGADMTRLVFRIVDKYGNRLPYTNQVVTLDVGGPADLIGENPFALIGGQAALYLKARHEAGTVTVRASTPRLAPAAVTVTIR